MAQVSADELFKRVLQRNTFYFFDREVEEDYDAAHIDTIAGILQNLRIQVQSDDTKRQYFEDVLCQEHGLTALLALTGLSLEQLKRVTTVARVVNEPSLDALLNRQEWSIQENNEPWEVSELGTGRILKLVRTDPAFRAGILNLFFQGNQNSYLRQMFPPFELKKLGVHKLDFSPRSIMDTLVRYKEKGSRSGKKVNNAATLIAEILDSMGLPYEFERPLAKLRQSSVYTERKMDFIVPDQENPRIIIESTFMTTTGSGQSDKATAEIVNDATIHRVYRGARFIGFVDGIGWFVRRSDLRRMVRAYYDVFTFHPKELERFRGLLTETFA